MAPEPEPDDLDRLLQEVPFVRALARQLVVDDPDEVVQQTLLQALEHRGQRVERPRSWLGRIARNVASNLRRKGRRRRRREQEAAAEELVPSSAELLEREEYRRAVVAAVDALPKQLRTVVLLRYYEGLQPRDIATLLDVPVETVWTQLRRGHERLRQLLDAQHGGDRRAWLLPLVPLALEPLPGATLTLPEAAPAASAPAHLTGAIVMTQKAKLVLAAVWCVAVGTLLWRQATTTPSIAPEVATSSPAPYSATSDSGAPEAADAQIAATPEREDATPVADAPVTGEVLVTLLHGESPTREPAPGYWLKLARRGGQPLWDGMRARTGPDGVARFEAVEPGRYYCASPNGAGGRVEVVAGETAELEIATSSGLTISGVVLDPDRQPVAGAVVEVTMMSAGNMFPEEFARTGPDGRFTARACPKWALVGARAPGYGASTLRYLLGKEGNTAEIELVLARDGGEVTGTVVGPEGQAVAHAAVVVGNGEIAGIGGRDHAPPFVGLAFTDEQGSFHIVGAAAGEQRVYVRAAGFAPHRGSCDVAVGATTTLAITLAAGGTIRGVVLDDAGAGAKGAEVMVGGWLEEDNHRATAQDDGSFVLTGLPAGSAEVYAKDEARGKARVTVEVVAGEAVPCCVRLSRGRQLVGRVVDPEGQPIAGAYVMVAGPPNFSAFQVTDAQGRVVVTNFPECGGAGVRVQAKGFVEKIQSGVRPAADEVVFQMERAMPSTVHIVGRVVDLDGRPLGNARVSASHPVTSGSTGIHGTDNDGLFRLGPVTPGAWRLRVNATDLVQFETEPRELVADETWDLGTVTMQRGGFGVLRVAGEPPDSVRYFVRDAAHNPASAVTLVEGELRTAALAAGQYGLSVAGEGVAQHVVPFSITVGQQTQIDVLPKAGVRQGFVIEGGADRGADTAALVRVFRGDEFVAQVYCRADPETDTRVGHAWLAQGSYRVEVERDGRRASTAFAVGEESGDDVRLAPR